MVGEGRELRESESSYLPGIVKTYIYFQDLVVFKAEFFLCVDCRSFADPFPHIHIIREFSLIVTLKWLGVAWGVLTLAFASLLETVIRFSGIF